MNFADDIEYLRELPKDWWKSHDRQCTVASILNQYGYFSDKRAVIHFFEKPWHYQALIDELIRDFSLKVQ